MKLLSIGLLLVLSVGATAFGSSFPKGEEIYRASIKVSQSHLNPTTVRQTQHEARKACLRLHRALYLIEYHWDGIREYIGNGINSSVLYRNRSFYRKHLAKRVDQCLKGSLSFKYERTGSRCRPGDTEAYVLVTLGWVHGTIHLCPLFFSGTETQRIRTLSHEYGRLEGVGDSTDFDTNNIYVWDAIISFLDQGFERILALD